MHNNVNNGVEAETAPVNTIHIHYNKDVFH